MTSQRVISITSYITTLIVPTESRSSARYDRACVEGLAWGLLKFFVALQGGISVVQAKWRGTKGEVKPSESLPRSSHQVPTHPVSSTPGCPQYCKTEEPKPQSIREMCSR